MFPTLVRAGYAVFAISYDRPAELKAFADAHQIAYPLLADEGSQIIRELGVLDQDLAAHHATFGVPVRPEHLGVAYPMTFILDDAGRVERKIVEQNYRLRYGGHWLLQVLLGDSAEETAPHIETVATGPPAIVAARARLDSPTYFPYQRLGLHLDLAIAPGWHIYAPGVGADYTALTIEVQSTPDGVHTGQVVWPQATPFRIEGLDESFVVYEGALSITMPLEFTIPRNSGGCRLDINVRFQTCNATECLPPNAIALALVVPEAPVP